MVSIREASGYLSLHGNRFGCSPAASGCAKIEQDARQGKGEKEWREETWRQTKGWSRGEDWKGGISKQRVQCFFSRHSIMQRKLSQLLVCHQRQRQRTTLHIAFRLAPTSLTPFVSPEPNPTRTSFTHSAYPAPSSRVAGHSPLPSETVASILCGVNSVEQQVEIARSLSFTIRSPCPGVVKQKVVLARALLSLFISRCCYTSAHK